MESMKMVRRSKSGILLFAQAAAACSVLNTVDSVCEHPTAATALHLSAKANQWYESDAVVALPTRVITLAYIASGDTAAQVSALDYNGIASLGLAAFEGAAVVQSRVCSPDADQEGIDPDVLGDAGAASAPSTASALQTIGSVAGAVVYRWADRRESPRFDRIRFGFLGGDGCPAPTESGPAFIDLAPANDARLLVEPHVSHLRDDVFAAIWTARPRDNSAADIVYVQLLQGHWPHQVATVRSPSGTAAQLTLEDRWIVSPRIEAVSARDRERKRLALVWYAQTGNGGALRLRFLDDQLNWDSATITLDADSDPGASVEVEKKISLVTVNGALFVFWTKLSRGVSAVYGCEVSQTSDAGCRSVFQASDTGESVADPNALALPDGRIYLAWKAGAEIQGRVIAADNGAIAFTNYGCGRSPVRVAEIRGESAFNAKSVLVGSTIHNFTCTIADSSMRSSVYTSRFDLEELFP